MTYNDQYDDNQKYAPYGSLLNRLARDQNANAFGMPAGGGGGQLSHLSTANATQTPAHWVQGVAVITDDGNDCNPDPDGGTGTTAPCKARNQYLGVFRWYEHASGIWQELDGEIRIDANGYFEGRKADGSLSRFGEEHITEAGASPTSGPQEGAVPGYRIGDVVPCFWDFQRGWAIPIQSPPQDVPRAQFLTATRQTIANGATRDGEHVSGWLEIKRSDESSWTAIAEIQWRVPGFLEDESWRDTRSSYAYFEADHNTQVRFRLMSHVRYGVSCFRSSIVLSGAGRGQDPNAENFGAINGLAVPPTGGTLARNLNPRTSVIGRFRDSPGFNSDGSAIEVNFLDKLDRWIVGVEFSATIGPNPEEDFSSSSLSTSSLSESSKSESSESESSQSWSSRSESSQSESSLSESSASESSASESSQSESSNSESSLSSISESSQSESSLSELSASSQSTHSETEVSEYDGYGTHFTCVRLVSDVLCDGDGFVLGVCYRTICFPIHPSLSGDYGSGSAVSEEFCVPCRNIELESSDSSQSESASSTSSEGASDSSDYECVGIELEADPYDTFETENATASVTVPAVVPSTTEGDTHWQAAIDNNQLRMETISITGPGEIILNEETGEITYRPPADGSGAEQDVEVVLGICDQADLGEQSSSSSVDDTSSSASSLSSSSESSQSESSLSSESSESSSSGDSSASSGSSSSRSSSSLSSSSNSSSGDECVDLCERFAEEPATCYDCDQVSSEVSNPNEWTAANIDNANPPEVVVGESWAGTANNLINNGGVVDTNTQLGDVFTDELDICYDETAIYQPIATGVWTSQVPITRWSQPWSISMEGRINSPSSGDTSSKVSEGPASLENSGAFGNQYNELVAKFTLCDSQVPLFEVMKARVNSCFKLSISADPCANELYVLLEVEGGDLLWGGSLHTDYAVPDGGWICQRYIDGEPGYCVDSEGNSEELGAAIPFGQLFVNQDSSQRFELRAEQPHMISKVASSDTVIGCSAEAVPRLVDDDLPVDNDIPVDPS